MTMAHGMLLVAICGALAAVVGIRLREMNLLISGVIVAVACGVGYLWSPNSSATTAIQSEMAACDAKGGMLKIHRGKDGDATVFSSECSI